jgi:hypothetical protein
LANIAESLADIELIDDQGSAVRIGSSWEKQPALLVFIRHFG